MKPQTWRLLETYDVSATDAMGLDEALLKGVDAELRSVPTLRLYTWQPDAISLGYFQAFDDVAAAKGHRQVVRRLTGGGAIHHHAGELTFSITLDAKDPAYAGSVPASYERTHEAIIAALLSVGVPGVCMRRSEPSLSDVQGTGMCFHESTPQDISWTSAGEAHSRKGVGTAQRRTGGRILHHGSIKVDGSPLEEGVATVRSAAPGVSLESVASALKAAIEAEFQVGLAPSVPTKAEALQAFELGARYVEPSFLHRPRRAKRER
jgi:lipoate-protein ligase A